jgi:site-specific DNA recombinase
MRGKHLYYRCNDRVTSFPLPASCKEKGVNARIADKLIWEKISNLMSSPDLMLKQAKRWFASKQDKTRSTGYDVQSIESEIKKLKEQEDRYNKAYGTELITLDQLRDYTVPIREKIAVLEIRITKAKQEAEQSNAFIIPKEKEIEAFSRDAIKQMKDLSFTLKREIVMNVIEKVVGTKEKLQVYGYIPITNVGSFTSDRNRWFTKRGKVHAF